MHSNGFLGLAALFSLRQRSAVRILDSTMHKRQFHILTPRIEGSFVQQVADITAQFVALHDSGQASIEFLLQARIYLSDAANQCETLKAQPLYDALHAMGVFSYIEQPPLCGAKIALLLWYVEGNHAERAFFDLPHGQLVELRVDGLRYLYQSVRFEMADDVQADAYQQTRETFDLHIKELSERGLCLLDHCQRTWFYVRDVDRHYAAMVKARNDVFDQEGLTEATHYISSTGIGGADSSRHGIISADFFSVGGLSSDQFGYLTATDYLNPTREYGVAFERGTWLDLPGGRLCMLSGTASIDKHGDCLHRGDVLTQTGRLFLNIEKLLASAGTDISALRYMIVYLRDLADYRAVHTYLQLRFPHVPKLLVEARVCRPEWLIEVECMVG